VSEQERFGAMLDDSADDLIMRKGAELGIEQGDFMPCIDQRPADG
jgi:hypothetical protein